MPDIRVTVVSPRGDAYIMEMPDDVPLRELLPEIAHALHLRLPEEPGPRYEMKAVGAGDGFCGEETLAALATKGEVTLRLDVACESEAALPPAPTAPAPVRVVESRPAKEARIGERPKETVLWVPEARGDESEEALPLYFHPEAYRAIREHTGSDLLREHGGYLLGRFCRDDAGCFVTIERALPAPDTRAEPTSFNFSNDASLALYEEMERSPGLLAVGWYHSHPRMAVFLSHMDLFIHKGYFREPWQVALVVEPEKDHGGFFRWRDGEIDGRRCGGFHEVLAGESVVTWTNMRRA